VRLYDRNATTWDDDSKVAAFVTAKDPAVLTMAKNVAGMSTGKGKGVVNPNLRIAMAIHNTLQLYGMNYVVDPKTPYRELSSSVGGCGFSPVPPAEPRIPLPGTAPPFFQPTKHGPSTSRWVCPGRVPL